MIVWVACSACVGVACGVLIFDEKEYLARVSVTTIRRQSLWTFVLSLPAFSRPSFLEPYPARSTLTSSSKEIGVCPENQRVRSPRCLSTPAVAAPSCTSRLVSHNTNGCCRLRRLQHVGPDEQGVPGGSRQRRQRHPGGTVPRD